MYKTKLAQWSLMKNYKATEKENLARIVKAHRDSGGSAPRLTLRNRPADLSRVRRFCKQQKFLEEICDAHPNESSFNLSTKASSGDRWKATAGVIQTALKSVHKSSPSSVSGLRQTLFDPERPFTTDSHEGRIELVLFQTRIFQQSRFASTGDSDILGRARDYTTDWMSKLVFGVRALVQQKSTQGWRALNEACEIFYRVLDDQSHNLFSRLFYALSDSGWTEHLNLYQHLLQFFTKSSAAKLGCNHPMTIVLYHLQEQRTFADAVRPVFEVVMDVCEESLNYLNQQLGQMKIRLLRFVETSKRLHCCQITCTALSPVMQKSI